MTPTDELWIDMAQFDTEIADGLWDGQLPADAPAWCSDVASLIGAARAPATEDELAAEDMIVSRMAEAILAAAAGDAPSDEDLLPVFPPVSASGDDDLDLTFVTAGGPVSGEVKAIDVTEADAAEGPEAAEGAGEGHPTEAPVNGTKVNGTPRTLSAVPPAEEAEPAVPAASAEAAAEPSERAEPSGSPVAAEGPEVAATGEAAEAPVAEGPVDEKVAALVPRPLIGRRRRPVGKRSGGPRHLAPRDGDEDGGTGRLRLVRRVVAVKAVATTTAVAIGITAAAAATGVVVTVVDPPKWPAGSDEESEPSTVLPPAMTIDLGRPARNGRPADPPDHSPIVQLSCYLDLGCPDPVAVLGPETAAALGVTSATPEGDPRPLTDDGPVATSTTGEDVGPDTSSSTTAATSTPAAPTTTTTVPAPTSTTAPPEPSTTTTSAPPPTTSTTNTTVGAGPATLATTTEE